MCRCVEFQRRTVTLEQLSQGKEYLVSFERLGVTPNACKQTAWRFVAAAVLISLMMPAPARTGEERDAIVYSIRFPSPEKHIAEVEMKIPVENRSAIDLMMPVWSPGFYRIENYAGRILGVSARAPDG